MCRAAQASQKVGTREEAQGSTSGSRDWGGREADLWAGGQGPKGDWHGEKMEKQAEGGGDSEKREGEKKRTGGGAAAGLGLEKSSYREERERAMEERARGGARTREKKN